MPSETNQGSHYFDEAPSAGSKRRVIELALPDVFSSLTTDSGVFSADGVDAGTKFLLQAMPGIPEGVRTVLDLGCGYGPIAITVAKRAPAATVWAVDVNRRALELAAANAAANETPDVVVRSPDQVPDDVRFDLIVSNPPIRIGKEALHELLTAWLDRLAVDGRAWLVVQKHLGSDSLAKWLNGEGWSTTRLGSRKGYRILEVLPR